MGVIPPTWIPGGIGIDAIESQGILLLVSWYLIGVICARATRSLVIRKFKSTWEGTLVSDNEHGLAGYGNFIKIRENKILLDIEVLYEKGF